MLSATIGESEDRLFREPTWSWRRVGDVWWWIRREWTGAILGEAGPKLDEWRREGRLTTVKSGLFRMVYRADLDEGSIYIKHYLVPGPRAKLRQWVRRGKGRNESKRARALARVGVPTFEPIALGEQRRKGVLFENYLITRAIENSIPLDRFVETEVAHAPPAEATRVRRALARALGRMTAKLHDAGFLHRDFHPGNVLVQTGADGEPVLSLVDLDALRLRKKLTRSDVIENLSLLNHYFWIRGERTDRHRFMLAYLDARKSAIADHKDLARSVERSTRAWAERLWNRWGERCKKTSRYFVSKRIGRVRALAARDLDAHSLEEMMNEPDRPFRDPDAVVLKDSRTTTVAEATVIVCGEPVRVVYKRFNRRDLFEPVFNVFRPDRGMRAWRAGQHLASRGVPTPRNLAYLAKTGPLGVPRETYVITVKLESARTLTDYRLGEFGSLSSDRRRSAIRNVTIELARLIRSMHERSLSHRDLKGANILIEGDPADGSAIKLSLIDLSGVQKSHPLPLDRRLQNLTRLHLSLAEVPGRSRTDSLRFLREYLPWSSTPRAEWKEIWRAIDSRAGRKVERNRRSGRPLS
jgi:tRNA A-37 threonylcarbamoyl transferase component Bud32